MPRKRRRSNPKQRYTKQTSSCEEDWCEIKGILDEREVDGDKQYLVAWEDHLQTGEVYPHEWVNAHKFCSCLAAADLYTPENQKRPV